MRLIVYNGGNRKLVITSSTMDLPQPIVGWLQESVQYRDLIDRILPASEAHLTLPPHEQAARQHDAHQGSPVGTGQGGHREPTGREQVRSKVVAAATEPAAPQPAENEVYHL